MPLVVGALACAQEPTTPAGQAQLTAASQSTFTFAPPLGTRFIRTDQSNYESSLSGTPLSRRQEQELRWQVEIGRSGDHYVMKQQLTHMTMKLNGTTTVDSDVPPDAISAQLFIDCLGTLKEVRGLENTSNTLRALAGPNLDPLQERSISPTALTALVADRFDSLGGDIVGHPTTPGRPWTAAGRQGSAIVSRTFTVEHMEPCGKTACARIHEEVKLNPTSVTEIADELVKRRVKELGGDPSTIQTQSATYAMAGTLKVDPATMLNHEAAFSEKGRVLAASGKTNFEVTVTGTTRYSYDYKQPAEVVGSR